MRLRTRLRLLLGLLLLAVIGTGLGMLFYQQPGYVLIAFKGFRYESSLWFFLALFGGLWFGIWLLGLLVRSLLLAGGWLNPWSKRARVRRALRAEQRGLLALAEGRFERALAYLKKAATGHEQPLLVLLAAARAAQQLGDDGQSTALLEQAKRQYPEQSLASFLLQAELALQRGELSVARDTLQTLYQQHPNHLHILQKLQKLLERQEDWLALQPLLPKLQKHGLLPEEARLDLEQRAACQQLKQAAQQQDARQALESLWRTLPKCLRRQVPVLVAYAEQLAHLGEVDEAEQLLRKAIKRQYDSHLVACYGKLQSADPEYPLKNAESWLKSQPQDPELLLALARLARASRLLDKACGYYEASLAREPRRESCAELAQLLLEMGESKRSAELFMQAQSLFDTDKNGARLRLQKHCT